MSRPMTAVQIAFEAFWKAYPKRPDNPKASAREVFERRVRGGADADEIAAAAGRYAEEVRARGTDPLYIPHARTWISQRRYEDYPAPAETAAPAAEDHPLAWLAPEIGDGPWGSWIRPLQVIAIDGATAVLAPHKLALDNVRARFGRIIEARLGAVAWGIQQKATNP